ncbi:MAG: type II toxin-antitoxin system YafQ family toxin [Eubacterium sp.]|nr:type II toxin-antitoxin system YafQ family toxin [Eubacterium sp.]
MKKIYDIVWTSQFKKDYKHAMKQHLDIAQLDTVIEKLASGGKLDAKYKDHPLKGNYKGYRECHIQPDWVLVYKIFKDKLILTLVSTGSHSNLFNE